MLAVEVMLLITRRQSEVIEQKGDRGSIGSRETVCSEVSGEKKPSRDTF